MNPPHAKAELRQAARRRLEALGPDEARTAADRVAAHTLALPELGQARGVLACLSFGLEIDTRRLIERLLESGVRVWVPRTRRSERGLDLCRFPCRTRRRSFGLEEPLPAEPALDPRAIDREVDVALILGLAFDREGYRLGYGGGYFDRFLAGRPFPALALAFSRQVLERVPREDHDLPMAAIVTEDGVHRP